MGEGGHVDVGVLGVGDGTVAVDHPAPARAAACAQAYGPVRITVRTSARNAPANLDGENIDAAMGQPAPTKPCRIFTSTGAKIATQ
jgi:hypothetical protein